MKNFIPHFITEKKNAHETNGNFEGISMFLDITGFTQLTDTFMKLGKEGIEIISGIINKIYEPVIQKIYNYDGFISTFAGDAFTVIFPGNNFINAVNCAVEIREIFLNEKIQETKFGKFEMSVKIGLSSGNIEWGIVGPENHKSYFFKGSAIIRSTESENMCENMRIVIDNTIMNNLSDKCTVYEISPRYYNLEDIYEKTSPNIKETHELSMDDIHGFFMDDFLNFSLIGEYRNISSVFINFKDIENFDDFNDFASKVITLCEKYEGFFNKIDIGDKGNTILVIFGAPFSHENDIQRAAEFALALKKEFNDILKIGITYGIAYSGIIGSKLRSEYTCLGDVVNLSSRLMCEATEGEIFTSGDFYKKARDRFEIVDFGLRILKGKSEPVNIYWLIDTKNIYENKFYAGKIFGRNDELKLLNNYLHPINEGKTAGIVYVYGDAGVGKSRFIFEFTNNQNNIFQSYTMITDSIIKKSMNPFINFFENYFKLTDCKDISEKTKNFEKIFDETIAEISYTNDNRKKAIIDELKRTKSIIGAMVGLRWESSIYETLDPKGKYENTIYSIKEFFKGLSLIKPLIIWFEDLQWSDSDSQKIIETIMKNIDDYPIGIIITSRFLDDGSKPVLNFNQSIRQNTITLRNLNTKFIEEMIENYFGIKPEKDLTSFISKKTDGNPFYIEQFCLYLKENNHIEINNNKCILKKETEEIPSNITTTIISRIDRLSSELKETIQFASVLGIQFEISILSAITNKYRTINQQADFYLKEGETKQIWSAFSEIKYMFKHALLQKTIYEMQLRQRLKELHKYAAETIEEYYSNIPDIICEHYAELAYHYEKAEIKDKVKFYLENAGYYYQNQYKNDEAINYYKKLLEYDLDNDKRFDILERLIHINNIIGNLKESEKYIVQFLNEAVKIKSDNFIALGKLFYGIYFSSQMKFDEALKYLEEIKVYYEKTGDKKMLSSVLRNIGNVCAYSMKDTEALDLYQKSYDIAAEINDIIEMNKSLINLGVAFFAIGDYNKSLEYYMHYLSPDNKKTNKYSEALVYGNIATLYITLGDFEKSMEYNFKSIELRSILGDKTGLCQSYCNMGLLNESQKNSELAEEYYLKSIETGREISNKLFLPEALFLYSSFLFNEKKYIESEKFADELIELSKEINHSYFLFSGNLLKMKLKSINDTNEGIKAILNLLNTLNEPYQIAEINYELYKITNEDIYRINALEYFKAEYEKKTSYFYKKRIDELIDKANK